jgi:hypothetical protein
MKELCMSCLLVYGFIFVFTYVDLSAWYSANAWLGILVHSVLGTLNSSKISLALSENSDTGWMIICGFIYNLQFNENRIQTTFSFTVFIFLFINNIQFHCFYLSLHPKNYGTKNFLRNADNRAASSRIRFSFVWVFLALWGLNYAIRAVQAKQTFVFISVA